MGSPSFKNIHVNTISIKSKDIFKDIFISPKDRRGFASNNVGAIIPIYFYRIIGVEDFEEYYNSLFNLDKQLLKLNELYIRIDNGLDTNISQNKIDALTKAWIHVDDLSANDAKIIIRSLSGLGLWGTTQNQVKDLMIKDKLIRIIDIFISHQKNVNLSILKNFCIKLFHWFEKYDLIKIIKGNYINYNPKVLFYGDIRKNEMYFLMFLSLIGFDVLYINSSSDCGFEEIDKEAIFSNKLEFELKIPLKPFPRVESLKRIETVAYQASREIESIINTEESLIYKPWQFESYHVKSNPLKTTYDELFILWKEEARFRTGFEIRDNTVYIPNIFAKINGTDSNLSAYWIDVAKLMTIKDSVILIEGIPFSKPNIKPLNHYRSLIKSDGYFDREKVFRTSEYKLSYLRTSIQNLIINKVNELIAMNNIFLKEMTLDFKLKILDTVLSLDKKYYSLLQKFDYPFAIPKIIIYDNNENGFIEEDFIILAFLYSVGFDIAILTPPGYNNVENGINNDVFDIHNLEQLKFDLPLANDAKIAPTKPRDKGFFGLWSK